MSFLNRIFKKAEQVETTVMAATGPQVFLQRTRMGPTVYVGPFANVDEAKAWVDERTPDTSWGIVPMQDPSDRATPDWA